MRVCDKDTIDLTFHSKNNCCVARIYAYASALVICLLITAFLSPSARSACLDKYGPAMGSDLIMVPNGQGSIHCDVYLKAGDIVTFTLEGNNNAKGTKYLLKHLDIGNNNATVGEEIVVQTVLAGRKNFPFREYTVPKTGFYHIVWEQQRGAGNNKGSMGLETTFPDNPTPEPIDDEDPVDEDPVDKPQVSMPDLSQNALPTLSKIGLGMSTSLIKKRIQNVTPRLHSRTSVAADVPEFSTEQHRGQSAGNKISDAYGSWLDVAYTDFGGGQNNPDFDGYQLAVAAGVDIDIADNLTVGSAVTVEIGKATTLSNLSTPLISRRKVYGFSPYAIFSLTDVVSLVAHGNISFGDNQVMTEFQSQSENTLRWSLGLQADVQKRWQNIGLLFGMGVNYTQDGVLLSDIETSVLSSGFTESGDISLHLQPSYLIRFSENKNIEPYVFGVYRYQYLQPTQLQPTGNVMTFSDNRDLRLGLGLSYQYDHLISGSFEWARLFWQDDYSETRLNATLQLRF